MSEIPAFCDLVDISISGFVVFINERTRALNVNRLRPITSRDIKSPIYGASNVKDMTYHSEMKVL